MLDRLLHRLQQLRSDEQGLALVLALGMSVAIGAAVTTTLAVASSSQSHSTRARAELNAQALAEAALNNAYATLHAASNPSMSAAVPQQTVALEGGTATWHGTLEDDVWTLVGVGRSSNAAAQGRTELVRTVTGRVRLGSSQQGTGNNAVWNYVYVDDPNGCTHLGNSVNVNIPLYTRGSLCMSNQASFTGWALQVGGTVSISNSAHVGVPDPAANTVHEVHVAGGCRLGTSGPFTSPCGPAQSVWSQAPPSELPTGLVKPPVDLPHWYENAKPGPRHGCTEGSFPGGFDDDTTMNRSRAPLTLTPAAAYSCRVRDESGELVGELTWEPGNPGTLTIAGTIFFDGDIQMSQLSNAVYVGKATIYTSGTFTMSQQSSLCGVADCTSAWDANENLLAIVAGSSTDSDSVSVGNFSKFQGAIYAVNDFREGNNTTVWGPIIARQVHLQNSTTNHYVPIGTLLPGMPATYEETVTLTNEPGSWG